MLEFARAWRDAQEVEKVILEGRKEFDKNAKILP